MRAEATIKNSAWGLLQQVVICVLSLFSRRVMLDTIGIEGVGLNGLLANVVSMLSVADLGISSAIVFHMCSPLAKGDEDEICRLMDFYRTVYKIIIAVIMGLGICLMPFMRYIVHDTRFTDEYVLLIYLLFLMQTSSTYLFAYKRSLLSADQKQYIITLFDLIFKIISVTGGIVILKVTNELSYYLLFLLVTGIINNMMISVKTDKLYPYIVHKNKKLSKTKQKKIFSDVKSIFIGRLSGTVTTSTDNILISTFVGTAVTGMYSNYTIILNTLISVMNQFSNGMIGSLGNLLVTEKNTYIESVLRKLMFMMSFLVSFCAVCLSSLIDPFITLAFGDGLLLERYVVYICIAVFYFSTIKIPVWDVVRVSGLFREDKYISIVGTAVNLVMSLFLGMSIGISGILIGTICTYIIQYILKIILFYRRFLGMGFAKPLLANIFYFLLTLAECLAAGYLTRILPIENAYLKFTVTAVIAPVFAVLINVLIFCRTEEFVYLKEKLLSFVKNYRNVNRYDKKI